jgi:hypothetical protein
MTRVPASLQQLNSLLPPLPLDYQTRPVTETEERAITREVLLLLAKLRPLEVREGRVVIPDSASEALRTRIRLVEGELLWALGVEGEKESGPRFGCAWVPARAPEPPCLPEPPWMRS